MSTIVITPVAARPVVARADVPARRVADLPPAAQLRLTARGRAVVLLGALALLLTAAVFLGASSVATDEPEATRVVTIGAGDTLWGIAAEASAELPGSDVRDVVAHIQELNGLDSSSLRAGERLLVPSAG